MKLVYRYILSFTLMICNMLIATIAYHANVVLVVILQVLITSINLIFANLIQDLEPEKVNTDNLRYIGNENFLEPVSNYSTKAHYLLTLIFTVFITFLCVKLQSIILICTILVVSYFFIYYVINFRGILFYKSLGYQFFPMLTSKLTIKPKSIKNQAKLINFYVDKHEYVVLSNTYYYSDDKTEKQMDRIHNVLYCSPLIQIKFESDINVLDSVCIWLNDLDIKGVTFVCGKNIFNQSAVSLQCSKKFNSIKNVISKKFKELNLDTSIYVSPKKCNKKNSIVIGYYYAFPEKLNDIIKFTNNYVTVGIMNGKTNLYAKIDNGLEKLSNESYEYNGEGVIEKQCYSLNDVIYLSLKIDTSQIDVFVKGFTEYYKRIYSLLNTGGKWFRMCYDFKKYDEVI